VSTDDIAKDQSLQAFMFQKIISGIDLTPDFQASVLRSAGLIPVIRTIGK
jgi:hypothetical protein